MASPSVADLFDSIGDGHAYWPVLTGVVERTADTQLRLRGPRSALCLTSVDHAHAWLDVLMRLDGRTSAARVAASSVLDTSEVLQTIHRMAIEGLVTNASSPWRTFHRASSNPTSARSEMATTVIPETRWEPSARTSWALDPAVLSLSPFMVGDVLRRRRSFPPASKFAVDPEASEAFALRLAHNGYLRVDACRRPVASAGGLEPIHLLTIGCNRTCDQHRVLALNETGDTCFELDRLDPAQLQNAMAPDPAMAELAQDGASAIVICADPRRVVAKYGNRGWRYALLEAGAVSHEIALLASSIGLSLRPVGGFLDDELAAWTSGLLPLLLMLVVVEWPET